MKTPIETYKFKEEDFDACDWRYKSYFIDVLNGDYYLDVAREDLMSLIGSEFDRRIKPSKDYISTHDLQKIDEAREEKAKA